MRLKKEEEEGRSKDEGERRRGRCGEKGAFVYMIGEDYHIMRALYKAL